MSQCRICKNTSLIKFLSLGPTPLANRFLMPDQLNEAEPFYPLDVYFCDACGLVQLVDVIRPDVLFRDYIYASGISDMLRRHFQNLADEAVETFQPPENALVVEIASNDGTLLKGFKKYKVRTLGVEPANNIAAMARASGIETVNEFFTQRLAKQLAKSHGKANVIIATNVVAHIDDLEDLAGALEMSLDASGVVIIEVPYLVDLLENLEYDTIYHEHLSYFAVRPLNTLFKSQGLKLFDAKRVPIHGGSLRLFVGKKGSRFSISKTVSELIATEESMSLQTITPYLDFAKKVEQSRSCLLSLLNGFKREGKRIIGYGAPAKGNTLLNYCGITTSLLDYIIDRSPLKQGKYTPGTHIPVFPTEKIWEEFPDYMLVLAWNFAEEIMRQQSAFKEKGGKFIIPIPQPRIMV